MASLHGRLAPGLLLLLALTVGAGCKRSEPAPAKALLFPELAERQDELQNVQLRGAGNKALVTLVRKAGRWRVAERDDWPADAGRLSQYLFVLSQTRRRRAEDRQPQALLPAGR